MGKKIGAAAPSCCLRLGAQLHVGACAPQFLGSQSDGSSVFRCFDLFIFCKYVCERFSALVHWCRDCNFGCRFRCIVN